MQARETYRFIDFVAEYEPQKATSHNNSQQNNATIGDDRLSQVGGKTRLWIDARIDKTEVHTAGRHYYTYQPTYLVVAQFVKQSFLQSPPNNRQQCKAPMPNLNHAQRQKEPPIKTTFHALQHPYHCSVNVAPATGEGSRLSDRSSRQLQLESSTRQIEARQGRGTHKGHQQEVR